MTRLLKVAAQQQAFMERLLKSAADLTSSLFVLAIAWALIKHWRKVANARLHHYG